MLMSIILSITCLMCRANPRYNRNLYHETQRDHHWIVKQVLGTSPILVTQHTNILQYEMAFTSWISVHIEKLNL